MMSTEVKEIGSIRFGIFSEQEIIDFAVCKVDNSKLTGPGSVYDERMSGNLENGQKCVTCLQNAKACSGHFGYIQLNESIIHPLFYKYVRYYLRCFCTKCYRLLITKEQIYLYGFNKYKGETRFLKILDKLEKVDICCHCSQPQPKYTYSSTDNTISMVFKQQKPLCRCECKQECEYNEEDECILENCTHECEEECVCDCSCDLEIRKKDYDKKKDAKVCIALSVDDIKKVFEEITDTDIELLGFNPTRIRPINLIMSVFPVIPPCARPFVIADGNVCDDDLTNQLLEIIKSNNQLKKGVLIDETKKQKALQSLKFRISTFYNNSASKAKHPTNGRPIKGIKERITGKSGQVRNNLMGKRVEFSGRTVIGPDPTLKLGQIAIPYEIAANLTFPDMATVFNIEKLQKLTNEGKVNFVTREKKDESGSAKINMKYATKHRGTTLLYGDIVIKGDSEIKVENGNVELKRGDRLKRNGKFINQLKLGDTIIRKKIQIEVTDIDMEMMEGDKIKGEDGKIRDELQYSGDKKFMLKIGDKVDRQLQNGDILLLNRQPTLHKGSMLAKEVILRPHKSIRMNLATTKTFNADFDGDEMNLHAPQSYEALAELKYLSATEYNVMSAQSSKPNIAIVQDALVGSYLMSKGTDKLTKGEFFDITMKAYKNTAKGDVYGVYSLERINEIKKVLKMKGKKTKIYNGRGLISLILPSDLIYNKKNEANPDEPIVRIYRGVLYEGTLDKTILGSSHNSLIQIIHKEYGSKRAVEFIDNIQFLANNWLLVYGFSVGLEDCMIVSTNSTIEIKDEISKCYIEAKGVEQTTKNPGIREVRINAALNKAKDIGMRIAKEAMTKNNNLLATVGSGSKGDFFNIAQLTGLLGQQNLKGKRVPKQLNHGKRTLPHYSFGDLDIKEEFESRGFIRHSFIHGLNPQEFYFHAMSGREGICDTALGTATSGYIQRRIVKVCEDIQSQHDGTVRDNTGRIYQFSYGENGLDATQTVKVKGEQQICDISRMVDRMNLQHEISQE